MDKYKEHLPTCYHIWILPFHYIYYSVADHLVQRNGYLGEKRAKEDMKFYLFICKIIVIHNNTTSIIRFTFPVFFGCRCSYTLSQSHLISCQVCNPASNSLSKQHSVDVE